MKRSAILVVIFVLVAMIVLPGVVSGQGIVPLSTPTPVPDTDGDGLPDNVDQCPNVPGPRTNNGCPIIIAPPPMHLLPTPTGQPQSQSQPPSGDSDGDGTPDSIDQCPFDGGPDWNNGCPTDQTAPPQPVVLPPLPTEGLCMVATTGQDRVNVRALPALNADVIDALNPAQIYLALAKYDDGGATWYQVALGWSEGQVLRVGGHCEKLPVFDFHDVTLKITPALGSGRIFSFLPVPGGSPSIALQPLPAGQPGSNVRLNFTNDGSIPGGGLNFLLTPLGDGVTPVALNPQPEPPSSIPGSAPGGDGGNPVALNPQPEVPSNHAPGEPGSAPGGDGGNPAALNPQPEPPSAIGSVPGSDGGNPAALNPQPEPPSAIGSVPGSDGGNPAALNPQPEPPSAIGSVPGGGVNPVAGLTGLAALGDGSIANQMGDGSVLLLLPAVQNGGTNPLNGFLGGLGQSTNPSSSLIGLVLPQIQQDGTFPGDGLLIGLLLPAVQTPDNASTQINPGPPDNQVGGSQSTSVGAAQSVTVGASQSVQVPNPGPPGTFSGMGGSLLLPAVQDAASLNFSLGNGWSLNVGGITQGATAQ